METPIFFLGSQKQRNLHYFLKCAKQQTSAYFHQELEWHYLFTIVQLQCLIYEWSMEVEKDLIFQKSITSTYDESKLWIRMKYFWTTPLEITIHIDEILKCGLHQETLECITKKQLNLMEALVNIWLKLKPTNQRIIIPSMSCIFQSFLKEDVLQRNSTCSIGLYEIFRMSFLFVVRTNGIHTQ